jgi:hypothetical protein
VETRLPKTLNKAPVEILLVGVILQTMILWISYPIYLLIVYLSAPFSFSLPTMTVLKWCMETLFLIFIAFFLRLSNQPKKPLSKKREMLVVTIMIVLTLGGLLSIVIVEPLFQSYFGGAFGYVVILVANVLFVLVGIAALIAYFLASRKEPNRSLNQDLEN